MLRYKMAHVAKGLFETYRKSLYVVVPFTTCVGFSSGLIEIFTSETKVSPLQVFTDIIGYTTLGSLTGVTYPLTFPVILKTVISN
jgi:hypothetical protein